MATIILAMSMSVLDSTIVNVALPSIARQFNVSAASSIWIINAYQMVILVALIPVASLGEIVGYRRIYQIGLVVFTAASLACVFARSLPVLTVVRAFQGLGAAGIMSVNAALVRFTFPSSQLGRAVGTNALAVAVAAAIGPTVGSAVLAVADWRWLFAINIPIGLVVASVAPFTLPHTEPAHRPLNYAGAALYVATFALLIAGFQSLAHEETTLVAGVQIAAGCAFAVALVRHELDRVAPLVPFDLLRIRIFSLSLATGLCSFFAQTAAFVALPFEIQRLGRSAVETGLLMTPWPVATAIAAPIAGRLSDRYPAAILGGVGLIAMSAGLTLLVTFPADGSALDLMWRMALCGLGFGFFQTPNNRAMLLSVPKARSGAAGGMLSTVRLLGQTVGAAGVAVFFRTHDEHGAMVALTVAAVMAFVASLLSFSRLNAQQSAAIPPPPTDTM
jgi:DHA2 family multidrug resistance protein-like MFS transporter